MAHADQPLARRKHRTVAALPEGLSFCPTCGVGFAPHKGRVYCDHICRRIAWRRRVGGWGEEPRQRSKRESEESSERIERT